MRRNDREVRDRAEIQRILEVAKVLRLGLTDGDYPYIVPLHYGYVYAGSYRTKRVGKKPRNASRIKRCGVFIFFETR